MHTIEHNKETQRFTMQVENLDCVLDYLLDGNVMTITHTGVPKELGGRGLAGQITKHVLDYAREQRLQVVAQCSYVAVYIQRHPEYQPLLQSH